jgi:hypothetical protein
MSPDLDRHGNPIGLFSCLCGVCGESDVVEGIKFYDSFRRSRMRMESESPRDAMAMEWKEACGNVNWMGNARSEDLLSLDLSESVADSNCEILTVHRRSYQVTRLHCNIRFNQDKLLFATSASIKSLTTPTLPPKKTLQSSPNKQSAAPLALQF